MCCNFRIRELTLTNYRNFEQQTFKLKQGVNVLAGRNGSGKTAVLEAAVVVMGAYLASFKKYVPSRSVYNLSADVAHGDAHKKLLPSQQDSVLTAGGTAQYPCRVGCTAVWGKKSSKVHFQRVIAKEGGRTKFDGTNPMEPEVARWEESIAKANHDDKGLILPLVLYLSSARLWNESTSAAPKEVYARTEAYTNCLQKKHGTSWAFNYIEVLRAVAIEERHGENFPAYEAIFDAVNTALGKNLSPGEEIILSTRYRNDIIALKMADGTVIPFADLSDGYRNVIKIILDIAVRMCVLNPYQKGDALKNTPGIVVIDEIEQSLHPVWQRKIIGILKQLFPRIQFICATNSPFIIQSLDKGRLISLDNPLNSRYSGESIEDIAEDIMGVEMPQYSEKKREMYQAVKDFLNVLNQASSPEELSALSERMKMLQALYSENPAYLALIEQEYMIHMLGIKDFTV